MRKNISILAMLLLVALPFCTWSQSTINMNNAPVGWYNTPPAQFPAMKVAHFNIEDLNPCSSGYNHWAVMKSDSGHYFVVGPLSNTTDNNTTHSGQNEPALSLKLSISSSQSGPWTDLPFYYNGAGPCYSVNTDIVDQGKYIKCEPQPGKWIRIQEFKAINGSLPVQLVAFSATRIGNNVLLKWKTATEVNNYGFEIQKSYNGENFSVIGFVEGYGTINTPQNYSFSDNSNDLKIFYRLKQIDRDGTSEYSSIIMVATTGPQTLKIADAYPNPFNPTTTISIVVPETQNITLNVFDVTGRLIETLHNGMLEAGSHNFSFNASALASGTYFVRLDGNTTSTGQKIILAK